MRRLLWVVLVLSLVLAVLAACGGQDAAETADDCLPGEVYDAAEQLCYPDPNCGDEQECASAGDGFFNLLLGAAGDLVSTAMTHASENASAPEDVVLVTYTVEGNRISDPVQADIAGKTTGLDPDDLERYQEDAATQAELWGYFTDLIPKEQRAMLAQYVVSTDGPDEVLASVEPLPDDPEHWVLYVDIADAGNRDELAATLIHEFGHLLTLNAAQVPPDQELAADPENEDLYWEAVDACPRYFPGEGCSRRDSYVNAFFDRFWTGIYDEWLDIDAEEDDDRYYERLDQFYLDNEDQFVTDYAVTDPEEDIAESWTAFVLQPKPAGDTIAEQKALFFYDYPELVKLRAEILSRTYSRFRRLNLDTQEKRQ